MENFSLNCELVKKFIIEFIKEEVHSNGFNRCVIGLSGGLDSVLVAYLSKEALGKENVKAIIMPYKTSNPASKEDALTAVTHLGILHETIDITKIADTYFKKEKEMTNIRMGNFLARSRMSILFDKSREFKALVMGTSNKSELILGYSTWYGDMAASLYPIGDLYKTQIFKFAQFMQIPKKIITKKPSADLWPGQTDEKELGAKYIQIDSILTLYVDQRKTKDEIIALGYSQKIVESLLNRIKKTQFKRTFPPVAKFSPRTFGLDFLYPHDLGK